jgi:phospholipid/cholesterol/gamma-HCH transport system ATP-binding protein
MIEIKHISKKFNDRVILENISAQFKPGMCNLIIGASGSGKTVLTKCIVDLFQADEGHIYFDGIELGKMNKEQRKELRNSIGMLFQGNALFDSMTVEENVKFPLDMFSDLTEIEKIEKVNKILARVNLEGVNDKFPAEISGGMKKRVGIARALVLNPKYLFCDEPNSGLDPQTSMVIDKLIHELTIENNITTIVVTHDMNSVMEIGDYILYLHQGHKEWEGNKQDIIYCKNELLNNFIFASDFLQDAKTQRMLEDQTIQLEKSK